MTAHEIVKGLKECPLLSEAISEAIAYIEASEADRDALQEKLNESLNNKFTYCAYCGKEFEIEKSGTVDEVSKHIHTCEKHPIADYRREITALQARIDDKISKLYDLVKIQVKCSKQDLSGEYMRGMANGLICALAVFKEWEPIYVEKPTAINAAIVGEVK